MKDITNSKAILAKLMAQENITVQHLNVNTATFDVQRRVLTCPIWKDMTGDIYDLLTGHEVGHALYTPIEGWHDTLTDRGMAFKSFLNIVEDARIEKKIKRKYPGLSKSFAAAYKELYERDFFGIQFLNPDTLNLIDRINLYFKLGSHVRVKFSEKEKTYVDRIAKIESWDEVVAISDELFAFTKQQRKEQAEAQKELQEALKDLEEMMVEPEKEEESETFYDGSDQDQANVQEEEKDEDDSSSGNEDNKGETPEEASAKSDESESVENEGAESDEEEAKTSGLGSGKGSNEEEEKSEDAASGSSDDEEISDEEVASQTDGNFRKNESKLVNAKATPWVSLFLPKPNLKEIVISYDKFFDEFETHARAQLAASPYNRNKINYENLCAVFQREFKKNNSSYINTLVKEFEMRKNAKQYSRQLESRSGELDTRKLHKYRHTSDIFKKITSVERGQDHGMIMFIDMSGSMCTNLRGTIIQTLILVEFCTKVGIPYDVYGFSDVVHPTQVRENLPFAFSGTADDRYLKMDKKNFKLFHFASSTFSVRNNKRAFNILSTYGEMYASVGRSGEIGEVIGYATNIDFIPIGMCLGGTPLGETVVASRAIIDEFKKRTNVSIVNVIHLTDGDGSLHYGVPDSVSNMPNCKYNNFNLVITDPITKKSLKFSGPDIPCQWNEICGKLVEFVSELTGARHIAFYVASKNELKYKIADVASKEVVKELKMASAHVYDARYVDALKSKKNAIRKELTENNFYKTRAEGFHSYYYTIVESSIKSDVFNDGGAKTKSALASSFSKFQKSKRMSRVILSQFSKDIAEAM